MTADATFVLSGFGDEIDPALSNQLDVLADEGLSHVDLRNVEETNVLDFDDRQIDEIRSTLAEYGFDVSSIGSPIGKVPIESDFAPHLDRFRTAVERAKTFDTRYIRIFSYYIPEGDDASDHREAVIHRMATKAEIAEEEDVVLVHENEREIYGDTPGRCRDILETVDSDHLRAAFDPANFVVIGETPYPDALLDLVEHVEYLHIKDARFEDGEITPAGEGEGGIPGVCSALRDRGFEGYASLEPHLAHAGRSSGYTGPEGFRLAIRAFTDVLDEIDASYV